jgi:hypothetical protein
MRAVSLTDICGHLMISIMEKRTGTTIVPEKVFKDQLVTVADLEEFKEDLLLSLARLFRDNAAKTPKKWLKSHEVKSLLNMRLLLNFT